MSDRVRFLSAALACSLAPMALAQSNSKLSVSTSGAQPTASCSTGQAHDALSPDGRFVVFSSSAANLAAGDLAGYSDVFLRDTQRSTTTRISLTTSGAEPFGDSSAGVASDDGRFLAFQSEATNLAAGDFNGTSDVFVRDLQTGVTTIVSASGAGVVGNGRSFAPSISADGLRIAFVSEASNLVANDGNAVADVFVRNLSNNSIKLVTKGVGGIPADGASSRAVISGDGRFIAYVSGATNLVAGHSGTFQDVFVTSFATGATELVSLATGGAQGNADSGAPTISHDGNRIAFASSAQNFGTVAAGTSNVFLRDRGAATTLLLSAQPNGTPANGSSDRPLISANGSFVCFRTAASNLAAGESGTTPDAYVTEISTLLHQRASVPTSPLPSELNSGGVAEILGVTDDGRYGVFSTAASNIVASEPNDNVVDIFRHDFQRTWFRDADGDTFGDAAQSLIANFGPAGYVLSDTDCDDTDPSVHPGATETCNGVDDDCDGTVDEVAWSGYCAAGQSQGGCIPSIGAVGFPSASHTAGFHIQGAQLPGQRSAAMVYGMGPTNISWAFGSSSTRCVAFPWTRVATFDTAGTAGTCSGTFDVDWLAFMAANPGAQGQPISAGETFYTQIWYRDPSAVRKSNLTAAISFTLCP